ncbi:hypothetical protein M569_00739 [Genlisea aurea]|uniref:Uncharacterized protein n=1 Tax=Genlisea aurea TaxID=192259 RepID=S8EMU3_9LAMI|nr:hypothetical protein M569_00739 [Genlisea aurea]
MIALQSPLVEYQLLNTNLKAADCFHGFGCGEALLDLNDHPEKEMPVSDYGDGSGYWNQSISDSDLLNVLPSVLSSGVSEQSRSATKSSSSESQSIGSPERRSESVDEALTFVDFYLSSGISGSHEIYEQCMNTPHRLKSPPSLRSKGSQRLAKRFSSGNAMRSFEFEWSDDTKSLDRVATSEKMGSYHLTYCRRKRLKSRNDAKAAENGVSRRLRVYGRRSKMTT